MIKLILETLLELSLYSIFCLLFWVTFPLKLVAYLIIIPNLVLNEFYQVTTFKEILGNFLFRYNCIKVEKWVDKQ